jgi:hypothetical protein
VPSPFREINVESGVEHFKIENLIIILGSVFLYNGSIILALS